MILKDLADIILLVLKVAVHSKVTYTFIQLLLCARQWP